MTITAALRPFVLTFGTGQTFLLTSDEAQRLLDTETVERASINRVVLRHDDTRAILVPATLGGGPAFALPKAVRR